VAADGSIFKLSKHVDTIRDEDGNVLYCVGTGRDISGAGKSSSSNNEKEKWFQLLVETMSHGIVAMDRNTSVTYCNNRVLEILDRNRDEVLGHPASEFLDEESRKKFSKEFTNRSKGRRGLYELNLKGRDGGKKPVLSSAVPLYDDLGEFQGSLSVLTDMRLLKETQETLKTERDKFHSLAQASPFGLVVVAKDGKFEYINPRFVDLFGYDYSDLPDGRAWRSLAFPDEKYRTEVLKDWIDDLRKAKPGAIRPRVYKVRCKDGSDKIVHFRPVRLVTGQDLMTCEDVTAYSIAKEEREKAYSILESALESTVEGILVVDRNRRVTACNRKFLDICGLTGDIAPGSPVEQLRAYLLPKLVDPNSHEMKAIYLYEHPEEESYDVIEFVDGRIMERHSKPQKIGNDIVGRVWSFRDVTHRIELERHLAEAIEDLKASNNRISALLGCARVALESEDFRQAAQFIVDSCMDIIGAESGHITVMDPNGEDHYLICSRSEGLVSNLDFAQPIRVTGLHHYVYQNRKSAYINRLGNAESSIVLPEGHVPLNNILLAPLVVKNRTLGFLALGNKEGRFTSEDQDIVENFAEIAAISLLKRQMAQKLEESEERYRMIFANSPLGIAHFDKDGVIVDCNDQFERIMGATYRCRPYFDMLRNLKDPRMAEAVHAAIAGQISHFEGDYVSVKGQKLTPLRATFSSIKSEDGTFLGGVGIFEDISNLKAAEKALLQTERVKAVAGLAAGVAHNFNNLLQILMGNIELSLMDLTAGRHENLLTSLRQMRDSVRLGAETVRRLQTFANVRQESDQEGGKRFDISDLTHKALEISDPSWTNSSDRRPAKINVKQDLQKGLFVRGRDDEILEVLINLIKNAGEACPNGGEITVASHSEDGNAVVTVHDTGIGIADKDLKRVFDPFWTAAKTNIGTGLGLALSHGIIKAHGGHIKVSSKLGVGTTFTVTLPLVQGDTVAQEQPEPESDGAAKNVLVVDDMEPIVEMLSEIMVQIGYNVYTAKSGEEAIEIYNNNPIDIVICDLVMPGIDGWKVGQAIMSICSARGVNKTPFVLLTGWGGQAMEQDLIRKSGVDVLLEKPIDVKRLIETVDKIWASAKN
ncbi:MAG: PAS domain S-box protein, partial [Desulfomonilaceae bacterium]